MEPETLNTIASLSQAVIALAALIASIFIPLTIHKQSRRATESESVRARHELWLQFDAMILSSPDLMKVADSILDPGSNEQSDLARKRKWIAHSILNILNAKFVSVESCQDAIKKEQDLASLKGFLEIFITDDDLYQIVQKSYGQGSLGRYCAQLRSEFRES